MSAPAMSALERFLARPSGDWGITTREAAWSELCALVDAMPAAEVEAEIARADALLARAYDDAGAAAVYFEDDQRVAPRHWCLPEPRPALALAREVSLDLTAGDVPESALLALARSPLTRTIDRVRLRGGSLARVLPALLESELLSGVSTLLLPGCDVGGNEGAARLAAAPALVEVVVLDLSFCGIDHRAVDAILASPRLTNLAHLDVDANCIDPYGELGQSYWDDLNDRLEARGIELSFL